MVVPKVGLLVGHLGSTKVVRLAERMVLRMVGMMVECWVLILVATMAPKMVGYWVLH